MSEEKKKEKKKASKLFENNLFDLARITLD
jgi:hypothetical protein